MSLELRKFSELTINFDKERIPLSSSERESKKGKYPYYGAQGIIDYLDEYIFNGEYLLIAEDGENLNSRSQPIANVVSGKFWVNNHAHIVKTNSECDIHYLCYLLNNTNISGYITGSAQPKLNQYNLNNMVLEIQDYETQYKISKILKGINDKIRLNEEINKNLLSIADAVFKKEFQNFEGYSEDDLITSDFGLIPKDWYYNTLDEISDVAIGKTPPRKETWWFSEKEGVKWVSIKDLGNSGTYVFETSEYLTEEAIEKFNVKLIPEDTIILSFKLTVGRLGITTEEMVTNEAIAHFKLDENSLISKEYLYLYLKNFNYEELGSTSSIAKAINSKIVKKIPVLIPTNNKMEEFKKLFENIFNEIKSNQLEINNLTKLRDTLLPKLMSGEIDVSKINCDLKIIIRKIYIKSSKLFLWRYLSENQNHIKNTKSNETLLKSRTIHKINKFLAKFNARYRYYRQQ